MCNGSPGPDTTGQHPLETALRDGALSWGRHASCDFSAGARNGLTCRAFFSDDAALEEALAYQGSFCDGADRKACATFMLSDYLATLMAILAPLFLVHRIVPRLAPRDIALRFHTAQGRTDGAAPPIRQMHVRFLSAHLAADGDGPRSGAALSDLTAPFRTEVEAHFTPLIGRLSQLSGLAPAAFWRLVADAVAADFLMTGRDMGQQSMAMDLALGIVKAEGSPLHNPQLHYFDLDLADGGEPPRPMSFRGRGGCCRFYTVGGGRLCTTCVLKSRAPRDRDLRNAMRRRLGLGA